MSMKPSDRLKIDRQHMPEQNAEARARNFKEVNLGLATEVARLEADRCLRCREGKCIAGCPVGVDIPHFVEAVADGDLAKAADILYAANVLPGITGRICPQETQCEVCCVRSKKGEPVAVGYLERFVADWARENRHEAIVPPPPTGKRVAIVGAGPAGLTCAGELARRGHAVTIFEARRRAGLRNT
jgi:glutamate synthase (NADPH/NADH) small chain